jgi:glucokinase
VVDRTRGVLVGRTAHLPHWEDWPIRDAVRTRLGRTIVVDNDANLAALAEHRLGAARGCRSSLTITIGTGIGCGIVIDDHVWHGAWGGAGEIGHLPLGSGEVPCRCGIPGCVEPEASGEGLAREALALGLDPADAASIFAAARRGDSRALARIAHFSDRLGATIGSAISLLNPECVVIGGGVARAGDALMLPLREAIERYALPSHWKRLRVVVAALGERAGCIGAGLLAWDAIEE